MKLLVLNIFFLSIFSLFLYSQGSEIERYKLAQSYEREGDFESAGRLFLELYNQKPLNKDYFDGYVRSKKTQNKFAELIQFLESHSSNYPSPYALSLLGEIYWRSGKIQEANKTWEKAIQAEPLNENTYDEVAKSQIIVRQLDKAISTYLTGRKELRQDILYSDQLSQLYILTGDYQKGSEEVIKLFELTRNFALAQGRIAALRTNQQSEKYLTDLLKSRASSNSLDFLKLYAWHLRNINKLEESFRAYTEIDEAMKAQGAEIFSFGTNAMRDGQYEIALKAFEYLIDKGKQSPYGINALFYYARTLEYLMETKKVIDKKEIESIIDKYKKVIKEYPSTSSAVECQYRMALLYLNYLNDTEEAEEVLKTIIKSSAYPQFSVLSQLLLGDIKIIENDFASAEKMFRDVVTKYQRAFPDQYFTALYKLAEIEYFNGNMDSAVVHFADASMNPNTDLANDALEKINLIESNKRFTKALNSFARAELMEKQKSPDKALILYDEIITIAEESSLFDRSLLNMSVIYDKQNRQDSAKAKLQYLLDKNKESIYGDLALFRLGSMLLSESKYDEAQSKFTELLAKYPRSIYLEESRNKIKIIRSRGSL